MDLERSMPLDDEALHGFDLSSALLDEDVRCYAVLDPDGELDLQRLAPDSQLYQELSNYLQQNAAAMPGTMSKKHESRSRAVGGRRAKPSAQWLNSLGKDLSKAEVVAITGAKITNIFVSHKTPTWEAYNQNTEALRERVNRDLSWDPGRNVRNLDNATLVKKFTCTPREGEYYAFHGSSRDGVFNICRGGFDPEYGNYSFPKGHGKTGYGTAFTDQFAKSLEYANPTLAEGQTPRQNQYKHYVIMARVFAGNPYDAQDRARRTRGNVELTQANIASATATARMMKAQGKRSILLGRPSATVARRIANGEMLNSTFQHRNFALEIQEAPDRKRAITYRDTSLTISSAIQMYPMFVIECELDPEHVHPAQRAKVPQR